MSLVRKYTQFYILIFFINLYKIKILRLKMTLFLIILYKEPVPKLKCFELCNIVKMRNCKEILEVFIGWHKCFIFNLYFIAFFCLWNKWLWIFKVKYKSNKNCFKCAQILGVQFGVSFELCVKVSFKGQKLKLFIRTVLRLN